jgi:hypothetical protein
VTSVQPAIPGVPVAGSTPTPYISAGDAEGRLLTEFGITTSLSNGHVLAASMALDEEAPFEGVKFNPEQERQWPRTFMYGWPNMLGAPTPVMVSDQFAGAFYLDYEQVIPWQVVDWVCLEAYRYVTLPFERGITSESLTGASVHYAPDNSGSSMLDKIQASLLSPFLLRQVHSQPFINFTA